MKKRQSVLAISLLVFLVGCSSKPKNYEDRSAQDLYNEAVRKLEGKEYKDAAELFDETERQHPYSEWATRAQLMAGFAHYQAQKYEDAISAFDTFIQLHPNHPDSDYAHYMKGLCHYEQIGTIKRDHDEALLAHQAFETLERRFPDSKYARAAKPKMDLIDDHMAGREMDVGRFYMKKENYIAALGRFKRVAETYQETNQAPEALHRLVECYYALGMMDAAHKAAAVLGHNFPGSPWYADTYLLLQGKDYRMEQDKGDDRPWYKRYI